MNRRKGTAKGSRQPLAEKTRTKSADSSSEGLPTLLSILQDPPQAKTRKIRSKARGGSGPAANLPLDEIEVPNVKREECLIEVSVETTPQEGSENLANDEDLLAAVGNYRMGPNIEWELVKRKLNWPGVSTSQYEAQYAELIREKFSQSDVRDESVNIRKSGPVITPKDFNYRDPTRKWKMNCVLRQKVFDHQTHDLFDVIGKSRDSGQKSPRKKREVRLSFLKDFRTEMTPSREEDPNFISASQSSELYGDIAEALGPNPLCPRDLASERFLEKHHRKQLESIRMNHQSKAPELVAKKKNSLLGVGEKLARLLDDDKRSGNFRRRRKSLEREIDNAESDAEKALIREELELASESGDEEEGF